MRMLKYISIICLFFVAILSYGQAYIVTPSNVYLPLTSGGGGCTTYDAEARWNLNNAGTDEEGGTGVTLSGGASYTSGVKREGTHSADCNGSGYRVGIPSKNYGEEFTLNFFFFKYGVSGIYSLYSAYASSDGFELGLNQTTPSACYLNFTTGNGVDTDNANSSTFAMSTQIWYQFTVVVNRTLGTVQFYVNGVDRGSGTCRTDFDNNRDAQIGGRYGGAALNSYAYYDVIQIALWDWTQTDAADSYATPGTEITICE